MLKSAQKATRGEGGFTLIELLVVMIIIAILMAVAVPTFLKQKQNALATKAKANVKAVVSTIESCAATNVTGAYNSPRDCTATASLIADEPTLTNLSLGTAAAPPADTCSVSGGGAQAYQVNCSFLGESGTVVTFSEQHTANGTINKTCTPVGNKGCPGPASTKMW